MTEAPDDLPLEGLSEAEKDTLIARLWRDFQAQSAHARRRWRVVLENPLAIPREILKH